MAVIYKCDICKKEIEPKSGKNPLIRRGFSVPGQDAGWDSEICPECDNALYNAIEKAKYEFWKSRRADNAKAD